MKYSVQLPPDARWSEWREIAPIPEKAVLSIRYDTKCTWEESNAIMKILFGEKAA